MNERVYKYFVVLVGLAWTAFLMFLVFFPDKPRTVENGRYQGKRMSCLWDTYPPDGNYEVTHGSDGTRGGEYSFWKDGKLVTTCNLEDK